MGRSAWHHPRLKRTGEANQNAYIGRFNRSFREEVLDAWVFTTLAEVRAVSKEWRHGYNTERSHESLGSVPPLTILPRSTNVHESTFKLCARRGSLRPLYNPDDEPPAGEMWQVFECGGRWLVPFACWFG